MNNSPTVNTGRLCTWFRKIDCAFEVLLTRMIETSVFLLHNQIEGIVQYWMSRHHVVVSSLSKSTFLFLIVSVSIFLQIIKIIHFILKDKFCHSVDTKICLFEDHGCSKLLQVLELFTIEFDNFRVHWLLWYGIFFLSQQASKLLKNPQFF